MRVWGEAAGLVGSWHGWGRGGGNWVWNVGGGILVGGAAVRLCGWSGLSVAWELLGGGIERDMQKGVKRKGGGC